MEIFRCGSTGKNKCVHCGEETTLSYAFRKEGLEVKIPFCDKCMEAKSETYFEKVKTAVSCYMRCIKKDIKALDEEFNKEDK